MKSALVVVLIGTAGVVGCRFENHHDGFGMIAAFVLLVGAIIVGIAKE